MNAFKLVLLACTLCASQFSFAQEPTYSWGEPATNNFPERKIDQLLALGDGGFVLLREYVDATFTSTYWLEYYSPDLKLEGNVQVNFNGGVMGDIYMLDEVFVANNIVYAMVSHWNKAAGKHSLMLKEMTFSGDLTDLATLDVITAEKMGNRGTFKYTVSDDQSKLLVLSEMPFVKKTKEQLRMKCFDLSSQKELWSHDQELTWDSDRALHNHPAVDNSGKAYLFKKGWVKPAWNYALYAFDGGSSWKAYDDLNLEGKEVIDFQTLFNGNNEFVVFGTYSTNSSNFEKRLNGSLFFRIDKSLNLAQASSGPWFSEMLTYFLGEKGGAKEDAYLSNFYIKDVLLRQDGKLLVLAEQLKEDKKTIAGSSPIQYTYEWNYGNFLALCLDPNTGDLQWWQTFQKSQELRSSDSVDEYGSFVYTLKEDRLYVLWNNTALSVPSIPAANWTEPDGTKYVKHKAFNEKTMHATFMQVLEPDGFLAYEDRTFGLPLFNLHEGAVFEMSMTTPFAFQLNGNLVVMAAMHNGGKRYRFGIVGL